VEEFERKVGNWTFNHAAIALLIGLLTQLGGFVWYAAKQDARVARLEEVIIDIKRDIGSRQPLRQQTQDRLARLETAKEDVARRLDRIEGKIDRILEKDG
jgi:hypothetical protein